MASAHVDLRNIWLASLTTFLGNAGLLRLYRVSDDVLLSEHVCGSPFAPAPVDGVLTRNPIANGVAVATGNVASARFYKADGTTLVLGALTVSDEHGEGQIKLGQTGVLITSAQTVIIDTGVIQAGNM